MKHLLSTVIIAVITICLFVTTAAAAVPQMLTYQGRLTNSSGTPLTEIVALTFTIYTDSLGTSTLWTELHPTVAVEDGLFTVVLGSATPIPGSVFTGLVRWLGIQVDTDTELRPLRPLLSAPDAFQALRADTASFAKTIADNSVTTGKIVNGTISFADIGQNGATSGQIMKWNGSAWVAAKDSIAPPGGGWVDNGTVVSLVTPADTVAINTTARLGKLNIGGNLGLGGESSIYFGTDATRITGIAGGDLRLVAEDLSTLTTEDITFGLYGVESWIKFDNANRRVGIGTLTVDDRLHIENSTSGGTCWLKIQQSNGTSWGQTGLRIQTPTNTWHLRQDLSTFANFPDGSLSLYNSGGAIETMTWLENGYVGVGTTNPTRKLHVYGSIQVKDTLYGGAINPTLMAATRLPDEPGVASRKAFDAYGLISLTHDWQTILSRQITVPAAGYVVALGHTWISYDHTYNDYDAVEVGISDDGTTVDLERTAHFGTSANVGTGLYSCTLAPHAIFRVTAAGTYTYYLLGQKYDAVSAPVLNAELILLYVPTAYGTVQSIADQSGSTDDFYRPESFRSKSTVQPTGADPAEELRQLRTEIELLKKRLDEQQR